MQASQLCRDIVQARTHGLACLFAQGGPEYASVRGGSIHGAQDVDQSCHSAIIALSAPPAHTTDSLIPNVIAPPQDRLIPNMSGHLQGRKSYMQ